VVGYDPGMDAWVPDGVAESEDELDVGVVFGHAKNEAAGGDFKGNGVARGWGWVIGGGMGLGGSLGS